MSRRITTIGLPHLARQSVAIVGMAMALGACTHVADNPTAAIPDDYRLRHPIAIQEADKTTEVFVGIGRGGLSAAQRTDIADLGQTWLKEGTGAIVMEVPRGTPNARSAADSMREIQALLGEMGVPPRGLSVRHYKPNDPRLFATIRLHYPRLTASVGPCGVWPDDLGPSIKNRGYLDNKSYYNFGCANQRNLAAMVANPSDLVQPRPEGSPYNARRTVALDKYRQGQNPATTYPDKTQISNVGQ